MTLLSTLTESTPMVSVHLAMSGYGPLTLSVGTGDTDLSDFILSRKVWRNFCVRKSGVHENRLFLPHHTRFVFTSCLGQIHFGNLERELKSLLSVWCPVSWELCPIEMNGTITHSTDMTDKLFMQCRTLIRLNQWNKHMCTHTVGCETQTWTHCFRHANTPECSCFHAMPDAQYMNGMLFY